MPQTVKNLLAMQKTWVQSLGQENPLEEGMVTHSSILAWRIPWTGQPGGPYCQEDPSRTFLVPTNTYPLSRHINILLCGGNKENL